MKTIKFYKTVYENFQCNLEFYIIMQKGWRKCYFEKSNTHLILWQNYGKLWYYMFSEIYGTIYCDNYGFIVKNMLLR